ncbi:MAG: acyl-CoA thioesterase [Treponema sp.]|jgi:acyl-CoA thioester hydrolase|nr:acyl-CoA thioesterase [Treponema sp.]
MISGIKERDNGISMRIKPGGDNGPYNVFIETETIVEFNDLDPMRIVWHANYFNYFEKGRRVLLEKLGYNYYEMEKTGYAFPVVEASIKYIGPLYYRDRIIIKTILEEYENRLRIKYEIRNAKTGLITTKGFTTQMAFDINNNESCFICPAELIEKIEALIKGKTE